MKETSKNMAEQTVKQEAQMCVRNTVLLSLIILSAGIVATVLFARTSSQKEITEVFPATLISFGGMSMFILIQVKILSLNAAIEQRAGNYLTYFLESTDYLRLSQALAEADYKTEESFTDAIVNCIIVDIVFMILYFIVTAAIARSAIFTTTTIMTIIAFIAAQLALRA